MGSEMCIRDSEDAALILLSDLQSNGFLMGKVEAKIELVSGDTKEVEWDVSFSVSLPRDIQATKVKFRVIPGPISYYEELVIENDSSLEDDEISEFFFSEGLLFQGSKSRVFTSSSMKSGAGNLESFLSQMGFQDARVEVRFVEGEDVGAKVVSVSVVAGPRHLLGEVQVEANEGAFVPEVVVSEFYGLAYSRFLVQDIVREFRNGYYKAGYPDVVIRNAVEYLSDSKRDEVELKLRLIIEPGSDFTVSAISYDGLKHTRESLVRSKVTLKVGDPLNPILLEESRLGIARIGVFGKVDYTLTESGEGSKVLDFSIEEKTPWNLDFLTGWGSYERLRGGVVAEKINVLGLGHRFRVKGLVSMKSTFGEARYSLPQFLNTSSVVSTKVYSLEREEQSFDRRELGVDVGLSRYSTIFDVNTDFIYSFESLESLNSTLGNEESIDEDSLVGSLGLRIGRDRRDNPINPRAGYRFFGKVEWASDWFGGNTNYELGEFGYSHHGDFGHGLNWHFGITGGTIGSYIEDDAQIPTGKLFYMGGENSIRGYRRGEAALIGADDRFQGASSYLISNIEIEQMLSESFSVVLFLDSLGQESDLGGESLKSELHSLGLGLRFKTFMGPIRFEYGHNLTPRPSDSDGAFHFSIGYPF